MKPIIEPILDEYEQDIEDNLDFTPVENVEELKAKLIAGAKEYNKKKAVNFKARSWSIETFKQRVKLKTGLPYQSFLNMMIHKYNRGELDSVL